jgi:hypothetical protein
MSKERSTYLSYLLRLWQHNGEKRPVWRASLQSGLASERQSFASLDELFTFLRRQAGIDSDTDTGDGTGIRQNDCRKPPSAP